MRDLVLEETAYFDFSTRQFSNGVPTTLVGSPVTLAVLEENNATPITAGVSVSLDRASVVGLHMATIVATTGNGYENGKGYSIYISVGTVGGVSVVGEKVGEFTIGASAAAQDLANGTDGLGIINTTIDNVETDTQDIQTRLPANLSVGRMQSNVDSINGSTAAALSIARAYLALNADLNTVSATASTIVLGPGMSAVDEFYTGMAILVWGGTGIGQSRLITGYVGSTKTATVKPDWGTNPDGTSDIMVLGDAHGDLDSRTPAALVSGAMDADVSAVQANALTATALATDAVNEIRDAILSDSTPFPGASITEVRLAELAAANLPANIDAILTDTGTTLDGRIPAALVGGRMDSDVGGLGGVVQSLTDLKDFADAGYDPATNKVQGVVLVDTSTANTDMRGTDSAALASVATEARLAELDAANIPADIDAIPTTAMRGTDSAALASVATEARLAELDAANLPAGLDLVLADTGELQTDWVNGGRLDLLIDAIKTVTDLLTAADAEPTGVPAANETPLAKLAYVFMALRNKLTITSTKKQFFDDAGNAEWEKDLSDDATTYAESEANTV